MNAKKKGIMDEMFLRFKRNSEIFVGNNEGGYNG